MRLHIGCTNPSRHPKHSVLTISKIHEITQTDGMGDINKRDKIDQITQLDDINVVMPAKLDIISMDIIRMVPIAP